MELNTLFGLPAHPLLVHLPVVMVPLAALGALVLAVRPQFWSRAGWWVTGASGIGMIGAILAAGSGEELEHKVERSQVLEHHAQLGETARLLSVVLFVVLLAAMLLRKYRPADMLKKSIMIIVGVALAASSVAATWAMVATGHNGAKASWCEVTKNCPANNGAVGSDNDD